MLKIKYKIPQTCFCLNYTYPHNNNVEEIRNVTLFINNIIIHLKTAIKCLLTITFALVLCA